MVVRKSKGKDAQDLTSQASNPAIITNMEQDQIHLNIDNAGDAKVNKRSPNLLSDTNPGIEKINRKVDSDSLVATKDNKRSFEEAKEEFVYAVMLEEPEITFEVKTRPQKLKKVVEGDISTQGQITDKQTIDKPSNDIIEDISSELCENKDKSGVSDDIKVDNIADRIDNNEDNESRGYDCTGSRDGYKDDKDLVKSSEKEGSNKISDGKDSEDNDHTDKSADNDRDGKNKLSETDPKFDDINDDKYVNDISSEIKKANDCEIEKTSDSELKKANDGELKKADDGELKKANDCELKKTNDCEIKKTSDNEIKTSGSEIKANDTEQTCENNKNTVDLEGIDWSDDVFEETIEVVASPLKRFRQGYLWVSDFTRQSWCEQQMYYTFTVPTLVEEKPVMTEGTSLHLERELAVHDLVNVKVTSNEDIWAIKVLNLLSSIQIFLNNGSVAREIPIFGAPFDEDVFVVGLIDELRFDPQLFSIELWELKTRKRNCMPSRSQKFQHRLQVMMYQKLFDDMVKGKLSKTTVAKHLRLDLKAEFGDDIHGQIAGQGFSCSCLDELMDILFDRMKCITCIQGLGIEYVHQDTKQTIGVEREVYNEAELSSSFKDYLKFWQGERSARGVDIEDAWKCQSCDFADICDWRKKKVEEYSRINCGSTR